MVLFPFDISMDIRQMSRSLINLVTNTAGPSFYPGQLISTEVHQMNDQDKTNAELLEENSFLNQRIQELEQSESERKRAEEALKKSEKLLVEITTADAAREYAESIINTVREPLIALDQDLRVVTASRSFYEVFKVNPEETVGQLIYDLGNKQWDIPKLRELLETILPNNMSFDNFEVEHVFPQIGKRTMLLNARRIPPPPEKMKTILLAIEDITERKQAEEALRENEEKYRNLVESISDVIYEIDSQGVIVYVSPIVKDVMGYDPADVIGKNFIEFVYKDDRSLLMVLLSDLRTGRTTPSEYRLTDKSGDLRWVRTRTRPIMEDGRFTGARGTIIDITERKNAEEEKHRIEERSRKVVEDIFRFIPEGVLVFSRKIELLRQNKAFREIVSGYAQRLGFAEDELENLIIDKVKAGLRDNNIKEIRIARKHEAGK